MIKKQGLLMRVGIDQTYGQFNAPINPISLDYFYLPIPQDNHKFIAGMKTSYDNDTLHFNAWCQKNETSLRFPAHLTGRDCHLDPDFEHLSYGDQATGRGLRVAELKRGDIIAFFASFKPIHECEHKLIYAIFGVIVVDQVRKVSETKSTDYYKNAHTRIVNMNQDHLIVSGNPEQSGRFAHAIPIGEFRNGSYRVTKSVLDEWGGLEVKDGFIQRSVCPPRFTDINRFYEWLQSKNLKIINSNY